MGLYKLDVAPSDPRFGKFQRCDCQTAQRQISAETRQRMAAFGMQTQERMTLAGFNVWNPGVQAALAAAQAFARNPFRCLMLWGPPGTGKSHLAMGVVNALLDAGREVLAFTAPDFLDLLRSGYDDGAYNRLLATVKGIGVLVLDDLGTEKDTEWGQEKLFQVIDFRYRELLPLLISTNVDPAQFTPRLADRLCDERWSLRVGINAPSYRRRK